MIGLASASGYRLVFDKVSKDGSGKADCEFTDAANDLVHGGLFRIAQQERHALDRAEGLGLGYKAVEISVETGASTVLAITYIATKKNKLLKPYSWYVEHVLVGARECALPATYISAIERVPAARDPDAQREARELGIYLKSRDVQNPRPA